MLLLTLLTIGIAGGLMAVAADDSDDETVSVDVTRNTDGDEEVQLTDDTDIFIGADSSETISALGEDDLVFGEGGNDTVFGGGGGDMLMGQEGDDSLSGDAGNDYLMDGGGQDTLSGGAGNDTIESGDFTDVDALSDQLDTGTIDLSDSSLSALMNISYASDSDAADGDSVDGGSGNDVLIFGENDTVAGGSGSDLFYSGDWMDGGDAAVVTDFDPDDDVLIYSYDPSGPAPVMTQTDDGGDRIILADGVPVIRLSGYAGSSDVTAGDVLLAERS